MGLSAMQLLELAKMTKQGTNLHENPRRYSDNSSWYTGRPAYKARGETHLDDPRLVDLTNTDFLDKIAANTLAHEGTHSKLLLNEKRKGLSPVKLSSDFRGKILDLLAADPEFLKAYTNYDNPPSMSEIDPEYVNYMMGSDEVFGRLNAMEAMMPAGTSIENSKYGKQLFGEDNEYLDEYLTKLLPEGYISNDRPGRFKEIPNQTTANPNKGVLEMLKGLFSK